MRCSILTATLAGVPRANRSRYEPRPSDVISLLAARLKVWDNTYFINLLEYDWVKEESPAGATQWVPVPKADATETEVPDIIMLTADIALLYVSGWAWTCHYAL